MRQSTFLKLSLRHLYAALVVLVFLNTQPVAAQQISIIRDAEVERLIRDLADPLLQAAGIGNTNRRIYIVADRRFNAFVVESGAIFINYGTILEAKTPNALRAVLAHEIGHLAGGHLARIRERIETTGRLQAIAMVLGMGAMAAGSAGGVSEIGGMASAFILAAQSAGVNSLMAFRRTEESAADASALTYLERAGYSPKGMVDVLELLSSSQSTMAGASPYLRSHPEPAERLERVETVARASAAWNRADSRADILQFELVQAKIIGFLESQTTTLNRYPNGDTSLPARYARIITAYRSGAAISAIQQMPRLVNAAPSNAYFHELQGQILLETGNPQEALAPLKRALQLASGEALIRLVYGLALVEAGGNNNLEEAILQLSRATRELPNSALGYTLLARAYGALGRQGEAMLAAAEAAYARGDKGTALGLARQAQEKLIEGSPAWLRADDILSLI